LQKVSFSFKLSPANTRSQIFCAHPPRGQRIRSNSPQFLPDHPRFHPPVFFRELSRIQTLNNNSSLGKRKPLWVLKCTIRWTLVCGFFGRPTYFALCGTDLYQHPSSQPILSSLALASHLLLSVEMDYRKVVECTGRVLILIRSHFARTKVGKPPKRAYRRKLFIVYGLSGVVQKMFLHPENSHLLFFPSWRLLCALCRCSITVCHVVSPLRCMRERNSFYPLCCRFGRSKHFRFIGGEPLKTKKEKQKPMTQNHWGMQKEEN